MSRSACRPLNLTTMVRAVRRAPGALRLRVAAATAAVSLMAALGGAVAVPAAAASRAHGPSPAAAPVFAWGDNSAGELGNGTLTATDVPAAVTGLTGVRMVAAGGRHALAVLSNGTVTAWGNDTFGQLGNGVASANGDTETPTVVNGLSGVTAVAAGAEHSLALLSNGTVMAWGDNQNGQLGNGSHTSSAVPVQVTGLTGVTAIAAGGAFSLALLTNGTVMSWGRNDFGQLGNGTRKDSTVPVPVRNLTGVSAIAAGGQHALALLSNGTAMSWGDNESDQLGDGKDVSVQASSSVPVHVVNITGVRAVAAGAEHSLALLSDGTVVGWGDNGFFQLGQPNGFPGGIGVSDVPVQIPGVTGATGIAAGGLFGLAIVAGGQVLAWGDNALGQLGDGSTATGPAVVTVRNLSGVTALAAGGLDAIAAGPAAASANTAHTAVTGPVSSPWRVTVNPPDPGSAGGLVDVTFNAVSAASGTDAWAVGASQALSNSQPLAEHWDGHAWHVVTVPLPAGATTGELSGVHVISPGNVWAAGSTNGSQQTLIEHFDGTSWSVVPSPDPATGPGSFNTLRAIAGTSATDMWAVGFFGNNNFIAMLFEHWNGQTWSFVQPPTLNGDLIANAVTTISPTDAWAVGNDGLNTATVAAHWDGHAWSLVPTPSLHDGNAPQNFLTGVTATASDNVWASGYEGNVNQQNFAQPFVLHWNGTAWSLLKVPDSGTEGSQLRGITALSASDIWASGETLESDGTLLTLTEHFNGTAWSLVPSLTPGDLPPAADSTFAAIASVPPATLFAAGTQELPGRCCLLAMAERTTHG